MFQFTSIKKYHSFLSQNADGCALAVDHYLSEIKNKKHLNAFLEVFEQEATSRAAHLDNDRKQNGITGKLHGVIIGLKDVISYKDHRLSASSKILENFTAIYNATVVDKLLQEGAIIIGRQNCDEFAMGGSNENSAYGNVLNAKDHTRVPGGSSGGSAVAVQADLCMVSLGSDTGGSVRQPADFCGIVGLKPTYGRVSRYGLIAYASSFDQIGIFSNTVEDAALVLDVISGNDEYDSTALLQSTNNFSSRLTFNENKKYKIACLKQAMEHPSLDKEIATSIVNFKEELESDGHLVEDVDFDLLEYIVPTYYILTTAEASSNLSRYDGVKYGHAHKEKISDLTDFYKNSRSEGFGKEVKRRIMLGTFVLSAGYYDAYFTKAQQVRRILLQKINDIFQQYDAIILPTAPSTAYKFGEKSDPVESFLGDIYTVFANLTGVPAISIPLFTHTNGMNFGMQVMTKQKDEATLLQFSKLLMQLAGKEVTI